MGMRLMTLALAGVCGMAVCSGVARADEIYTFTQTGGTSLPVYPVTAKLDIADAAVQSGRFDLQEIGGPVFYKGDVSDFISFSAPGAGAVAGVIPEDSDVFYLAFTFDAAGDIASDNVVWYGPSDGGKLSGDGTLSTGIAQSDSPVCDRLYSPGLGGFCGTVSGSWTRTGDPISATVPEPASFAILGIGLIGLAAARRRLA
jgi:hypothetical protein